MKKELKQIALGVFGVISTVTVVILMCRYAHWLW